jgi:hypothetical protein
MKPMVRLASKRGARAGFPAPARARSCDSAGWGSAALVIALRPGHPAATSRDKTG